MNSFSPCILATYMTTKGKSIFLRPNTDIFDSLRDKAGTVEYRRGKEYLVSGSFLGKWYWTLAFIHRVRRVKLDDADTTSIERWLCGYGTWMWSMLIIVPIFNILFLKFKRRISYLPSCLKLLCTQIDQCTLFLNDSSVTNNMLLLLHTLLSPNTNIGGYSKKYICFVIASMKCFCEKLLAQLCLHNQSYVHRRRKSREVVHS